MRLNVKSPEEEIKGEFEKYFLLLHEKNLDQSYCIWIFGVCIGWETPFYIEITRYWFRN